jgi:hypothetical protein
MLSTPQPLPDDPAPLRERIAELSGQVSTLSTQLAEAERTRQAHLQHIDQLLEYIELFKRKRFGRSADQVPDTQLRLFDETELEALIGELERELEKPSSSTADTSQEGTAPPKRRNRLANYGLDPLGVRSSVFKLKGRSAAMACGVLAPGRCSKRWLR